MEQLKLNMIPNGVNPVFHASQNDKGRQIRFVLDETLSGAEVTVSYRAKDGTEYGNVQMSVSGNTITDTIPEEVLTDYGIIEGEVNINGIGSLNFFVEVEKDAYDGGVITTQTAKGAIATFETNIETAFVSLKTDINPVQDLHGYSKPWSGGGGKNKAHVTATSQTISGVAYTVATDGRVKANGTASGASILDLGTITLIGGTEYTLTGCPSGGSGSTYALFLRGSGSFAQKIDFGGGNQFTVTDTVTTTLSMIVYNGYTASNLNFEPMVRLSNTSADFEPYSNICPISGFSALNVTRTGVNLWDEQWEVGYISVLDGRNSSSQVNIRSKNYIPIKPNVSLYLKANIATVYCPIIFYDKDKNFLSSVAQTLWNRTITTPENAYYMRFYMHDSYGTTYNNDISINYPSSDTEYHAYNGQTATVNFGQTVYGGSLDVTNGKVTITQIAHVFDGSENFLTLASGRVFAYDFGVNLVGSYNNNNSLCSHFHTGWGSWDLLDVGEYLVGGGRYGGVNPDMTLADYKTYLQAQYSNGTPVTLVATLATPIEITTTPENLTALSGQNNVYSDTNGDTTVEYYIEV